MVSVSYLSALSVKYFLNTEAAERRHRGQRAKGTIMELKFKVQTKIQKPVAEVFDAVYNPSKLSGYFTNGGASAPLDEGTTVEWAFADNRATSSINFR